MDEQKKYIKWIMKLVMKHKDRAKEVYHLLVGFLGG